MTRIRIVWLAAACGVLLVCPPSVILAQTKAVAESVQTAPVEPPAKRPPIDGLRLQESDDLLVPLEPVKPRTAQGESRLDAMSWFMTGRLKQTRREFKPALEAYQRAIELDPEAAEVYRAMVATAIELREDEDAVKYALKAIELDPDDYNLLRMVGTFMAGKRNLPEAIQLLEKAVKSPRLEKASGYYVTLRRDMAVLYAATGQKEKAADSYEVVFQARHEPEKFQLDFQTRLDLEKRPSTSYETMGQAFLDADRIDLAVLAFEKAADARQGKPGALNFNLARVYVRTKRYDDALDRLQSYLDAQLQTKGRAPYELLGEILKELKKEDELLPRLEALAEKDPKNVMLLFYVAELYALNDRLSEAEKLYKQALNASGEPEGYIGLAAVYRRMNKPEELLLNLAAAFAKDEEGQRIQKELDAEFKAIAGDEKLADSLFGAGRKLAEGDNPKLDYHGGYLLARLASQAKRTDAVIEFFAFAVKLRRGREAALLFEEFGIYLLQMKEYLEAKKSFQDAVDHPSLAALKPHFLSRLSQAQEGNGETDAALATIAEARKLGDSSRLQFQEAWIYYHSRKWDEAVQRFEKIIDAFRQSQNPQDLEVVRRSRFSLSSVYVQRGDIRKGEEILEQILAETPDDVSVNNDLGYLWADQGKNLDRAEKMIRKAIEAEPDNAAYLDSLGWVLFKLGKHEEALPHLEKAAHMPEGGDATIWDHLGDCFDRLKKHDQAKQAWEKALKQSQDEPQSDEKLVKQLQEKLKNQPPGASSLRPEKPGAP